MAYIKKEFLDIAKGRSKELFLAMKTLSKFAVVGVISDGEFDIICNYLRDIGANFGHNGKYIIWLENLPKSLQDLFLRYANK